MHKPYKPDNKPKVRALYGGTFDPPHYGHLRPLLTAADALKLPSIELLPAHIPVFKAQASAVQHRLAMTQALASLDKRLSVNTIELLRNKKSFTVDTLRQLKQAAPSDTLIFIIGSDSLANLHTWQEWRLLFDYCHILVLLRPSILDNTNDDNKGSSDVKHAKNNAENLNANNTLALNLYNFRTATSLFDSLLSPEMDDSSKAFLLSKLARPDELAQNPENQGCKGIAFTDIMASSEAGKLCFVNNQQVAVSSTFIRAKIAKGESINEWVPNNVINYIKQHRLYLT